MTPNLWVPILSAAIAAVVSIALNIMSRRSTSKDVEDRINAEREITNTKLQHERDGAISQRAWADYGLRRDIYLELAARIGVLFESNRIRLSRNPDLLASERDLFFATTRKIRLIGSDEVVSALNEFTGGIVNSQGELVHEANFSKLMNMIRRDIRTLNAEPPQGTALDENAFPLEG